MGSRSSGRVERFMNFMVDDAKVAVGKFLVHLIVMLELFLIFLRH
jgi:hypothetical protein